MKERQSEFFKLFRGETVSKRIIEAENSIGMENIEKMIKEGKIVGQVYFDRLGNFDTIYWLRERYIDKP